MQIGSNLERIAAVSLHAKLESLGSTVRQPAVVRARNGARCVLQEASALGKGSSTRVCRCRGDNERTHDDVGVAVDVLGQAVYDGIGAEKEWGRIEWGQEGIVN